MNLRFHGTSIHFAQEIIKSGGIFSSRDRLDGYISSTNNYDEISVTSLDNVDYIFKSGMPYDLYTSIGAMDIYSYKYLSYPAGCMFILIPRNKEESDMIKSGQMHNVDFIKNPEALYAIMTTTENIDRVQSWMKEKGLDSRKVCTMKELVKKIELDVWRRGLTESSTTNIDRSQYTPPNKTEDKSREVIIDE